MAKQTTITIETNSLLVVRGAGSMRAWCPRCGAEAEMIALESLGVVSNLDRSAVEEWLNSQELHRTHAATGSQVICVNSLVAHLGMPKQLGADERDKKERK